MRSWGEAQDLNQSLSKVGRKISYTENQVLDLLFLVCHTQARGKSIEKTFEAEKVELKLRRRKVKTWAATLAAAKEKFWPLKLNPAALSQYHDEMAEYF